MPLFYWLTPAIEVALMSPKLNWTPYWQTDNCKIVQLWLQNQPKTITGLLDNCSFLGNESNSTLDSLKQLLLQESIRKSIMSTTVFYLCSYEKITFFPISYRYGKIISQRWTPSFFWLTPAIEVALMSPKLNWTRYWQMNNCLIVQSWFWETKSIVQVQPQRTNFVKFLAFMAKQLEKERSPDQNYTEDP